MRMAISLHTHEPGGTSSWQRVAGGTTCATPGRTCAFRGGQAVPCPCPLAGNSFTPSRGSAHIPGFQGLRRAFRLLNRAGVSPDTDWAVLEGPRAHCARVVGG